MGKEQIVIPVGSVMMMDWSICVHIVAEGGESAETDKFDSRSGDIMDPGAE
jgi:hypothetical protein